MAVSAGIVAAGVLHSQTVVDISVPDSSSTAEFKLSIVCCLRMLYSYNIHQQTVGNAPSPSRPMVCKFCCLTA